MKGFGMTLNLKTKLIVSLAGMIGSITPAFASECNPQKLNEVFSLIAQRSSLEEGVAAYKFIQKKPVYDASVELNALTNIRKIAVANQVNPNDLMVFAQIQMDQAKFIQQYWINFWTTNADNQPDPAITPSIDSLKSQINALDDKMYSQLITNINELQVCSQDEMLKQMTKANGKIRGIPQNPNYNHLTVSAISNISHQDQ